LTTTTKEKKETPLSLSKLIRLQSFSFMCGVLTCFAFAPMHAWFMSILMPALVFKIWQYIPSKWVPLSGFLYGIGLYGAGTSWVYQSIVHFSNASIFASLSLTLLFIIYFSLFYGVMAFMLKRYFDIKSNLQILLIWPAIWVLMEWCIGHFVTGFPWLLIGYTQITSPLHSFASIVGVYGMSYITIFMAAILVILTQQSKLKSYWATWALLAVIVLLSLWAKHQHWTHPNKVTQQVSLVQAELPPTQKWLPSTLPHIESTYLNLSSHNWLKSNLIIWPESALPVLPEYIHPWLQSIQTTIQKDQSHLITGIITRNNKDQYFNTAMLLAPNQHPQLMKKRHLVPFGEYFPFRHLLGKLYKDFQIPMSDLSPGPKHQHLLTYGSWKIAPYICYEIAYPDEVIDTMKDANLLLVISDDSWFGHSFASFQHLGIAQMRAIETGHYVIFANDTGPSAIITPNGSLLKETKANEQTVLTGSVMQMTGKTPFMVWGSWPVLIWCLVIVAGVFVYLKRKKHNQ